MSAPTRTVTFPEDLASKIVWSPSVTEDSSRRSSRASYVLVASESHSSIASPAVMDIEPDSAASVSPTAIESAAGLDDAAVPISIDVISADDSTPSMEETVPRGGEVIPKLSSSIQEEIKAHIAYKLSVDVQIESINSHRQYCFSRRTNPLTAGRIVEPLIHIYCPHAGCHEVIDEAVRGVAKDEGADVLTLDALELSLSAEAGILGAQMHMALSDLYRNPTIHRIHGEAEAAAAQRRAKAQWEKDAEIQAVFNALVTLSPSGSTQKRIIYIRDFGSIAKVSSPIIIRLLLAINARRTGKFFNGVVLEDLVQPTLLVLGYSNATSSDNIAESTFIRGGEALRNALPNIDKETLRVNMTYIYLSPIGSRFFLHSLVVNKGDEEDDSDDTDSAHPLTNEDDSDDTDSAHPLTNATTFGCITFNGPFYSLSSFDLSSASLAISVFFTGAEKKAFASLGKALCERRKVVVSNAWLKLSLIQRKRRLVSDDVFGYLENDADLQKSLVKEKPRGGASSSKKSSNKSKEPRDSYKGQHLLSRLAEVLDCSIPVALENAVAIVLGLTNREQGSSDVPQVPLSVFSKAFHMLIQNRKSRIAFGKKEKDTNEDSKDNKYNVDSVVKSVKDAVDLTGHERKLLPCIVNPNELTTAFKDVCISEKTIESLRTIISLRLKFPGAFTSGVLGRESMGGVLLYGPPGTGKTMACRAVARECGARMLVIKPSDIMNLYVGESEKLVKAIFSLAYRLAPCLIFIDELDSTFGKRKEDDKKWVRDILAEFLQSMDGLKSAKKNKDAGVIVIGATNRPQDIDEAVIRRLPSRMMVDAPDETQRQRILELHLRGEIDDDVKLDDIAAKTNNYSGSDLKNLCVVAAMASVKEAIGAFTWEPISSMDVPKAGHSNDETDLVREKVDKRTVKMKHIVHAISEVPGSLASGLPGQSELQRWHNQYGTGVSLRPSYDA